MSSLDGKNKADGITGILITLTMGAILHGLKKGTRFAFDLLAQEYDDVAGFWNWWWQQNGGGSTLIRPYTIQDRDPILQPTVGKTVVDTVTFSEAFYPFLKVRLEKGVLPLGINVSRQMYRDAVARHLAEQAKICDSPTVVFVGGGYGAGKTTTLSMLANKGRLPFDKVSLLGVDYCKLLIPEFDRIKAVSDGRASEVCQEEARLISEQLFSCAIAQGRSFAWDSSMSNFEETLKKITSAKSAGYELWMIGVWTPVEIAIQRAMKRAFETRRFAHPSHLEPSTQGFARNFERYFPYFDCVQLYENSGQSENQQDAEPRLIAEKDPVDSMLAMDDEFTTKQFLQFGQNP